MRPSSSSAGVSSQCDEVEPLQEAKVKRRFGFMSGVVCEVDSHACVFSHASE